jgi:hypothetical protein
MNYWLVVGSIENWKIGLGKHVWGLPLNSQNKWQKLDEGDVILSYVTRPVRGIVGYGLIISKKIEIKAIFPDEKEIESALYPLRIYFETKTYLPFHSWEAKGIRLNNTTPPRHALQKLNAEYAKMLLKSFK